MTPTSDPRHDALIRARDSIHVDLMRLREATAAAERKLAALNEAIMARVQRGRL